MAAYWILYCYVFATTFFYSTANNTERNATLKNYVLLVLICVLIVFAGVRGIGVDRDAANYLTWFNSITDPNGSDPTPFKDPAFYIIGKMVGYLEFDIVALFLIFSSISIWFKISLLSYNRYIPIAGLFFYLYFCRFYLVNEMTAIRAGAGIIIASFALMLFYQKKWTKGISLFIISLAFHLSTAIIFPFFVLAYLEYNYRSRLLPWLMLITALVISKIIGLSVLLHFNSFDRLTPYLNNSNEVEKISLFSFYLIVKLSLLLLISKFLWRQANQFDRTVTYLVVYGICIQLFFIDIPVLALRLSEVFAVFDILFFLIPVSILTQNNKRFYIGFIFLLGLVFFISSLRSINPYYTV